MSRLTLPTTALLAAGLLSAAVLSPSAQAADPARGRPERTATLSSSERQVVHRVTQHLRTPEAAVAAGYVATDVCVEAPGLGGMGYHYVHLGHLSDGALDPARPEVLVFVPTTDGRRRLGAVEYLLPDRDQSTGTDDDRPSLFGRHAFDGPMLGHEPGMPVHYDLHVWLYERNPSGQLQPWNPAVHCPAA